MEKLTVGMHGFSYLEGDNGDSLPPGTSSQDSAGSPFRTKCAF